MSIVKPGITRKKYTEKNYNEVKNDIIDFIRKENSLKENSVQKISRTKVSSQNFLYYLDLCQKAKNRYLGDYSRNTIQNKKKNKDYHPYYFLKKKKNEIIIVFSGTSEMGDYLLDFKIFRNLLNNVLVEHINIASKILFYYNIIEIIKTYKKITIVGFSLGAVIASYVMLILTLINKKFYSMENVKLKLCVFACPVCLPEVLLKYINPITTAVVNEKDPVVCFRGLNITPLFTVGGDNIYNFVKDSKTNKVVCYKRNYKYFTNLSGYFYDNQKITVHYLTNLQSQINSFLNNS